MDKVLALEDNTSAKTKEGATISPKPNSAYDLISRNLTEQDLKNPAVVRMIINERDRLQIENTQMKNLQEKCYIAETRSKVLEEKMKTFTAFEILSTGTIGAGFLFAGVAFNPFNWIYLFIGILLVIVGIVAKTIKII